MPPDVAKFAFSERQRNEIARIFDESIDRAEAPGGSVSEIEQIVRQFLAGQVEGNRDNLPNADPVSMRKHRGRADKLVSQVAALRDTLDASSRREGNIVDDVDFRSNIVGCLALAGPIKRKRRPLGENDTTDLVAFLKGGEFALETIAAALDHLQKAAYLWREYCTGDKGRPSGRNSALIACLYHACCPLPFSDPEAGPSPAAPNSRLTRTFGVVMEALDWPLPANVEQAVRRGLGAMDVDESALDDYYYRVQGFEDQK